MPTPHNPPAAVRRALRKLGADIHDARRRRRLPMAVVAERAFTSRSTLQKVEAGDTNVSIGIYAGVLQALGPLHQAAAPCVGRGVSDGAESHQSGRRGEGTTGQGKGRLEREPVGINQPRAIIFEKDSLRATDAIAPGQANGARAAVQVDMHLEVSHRETIRLFA